MASTALKSQGATIARRSVDSPVTFTTVANITTISLSGPEAGEIDVTDLSSTAKEFLQGLEDPGTCTINGFYNSQNTQHQAMRDAIGGSTTSRYRITLSNGAQIEFDALVQNMPLDIAVDGAVEMSMTLKISGDITWTAASPA